MSFYYLEVTRGTELGRRYALRDGAVSIGRSTQNTIVIHPSEKGVSGHHMIIYKSPERIIVQDLQSTNGTYINELKINEREMVAGDELGFGKSGPRLKLVVSETELDNNVRKAEHIIDTALVTHEDLVSPFLKRATKDKAMGESRERETVKMPSVEQPPGKKVMGASGVSAIAKETSFTSKSDPKPPDKAKKKGKKRWLYAAFAVLVVLAGAAVFFVLRAL